MTLGTGLADEVHWESVIAIRALDRICILLSESLAGRAIGTWFTLARGVIWIVLDRVEVNWASHDGLLEGTLVVVGTPLAVGGSSELHSASSTSCSRCGSATIIRAIHSWLTKLAVKAPLGCESARYTVDWRNVAIETNWAHFASITLLTSAISRRVVARPAHHVMTASLVFTLVAGWALHAVGGASVSEVTIFTLFRVCSRCSSEEAWR